MSPEQCRGERGDTQSDIYSVGCLIYYCLTARNLISGDSAFDAMQKHLSAPADLRPVPAHLRAVVARCLEKSPSMRYQTVAELREDWLSGLRQGGLPPTSLAKRIIAAVFLIMVLVPLGSFFEAQQDAPESKPHVPGSQKTDLREVNSFLGSDQAEPALHLINEELATLSDRGKRAILLRKKARALSMLNRNGQAVSAATEALQIAKERKDNPRHLVPFLLVLGKAYFQNKQYDKAEHCYLQIIENEDLDQERADRLLELSLCYTAYAETLDGLQRHPEAEACLKKGLVYLERMREAELDGRAQQRLLAEYSVKACLALATHYTQTGNLEKASAAAEQAGRYLSSEARYLSPVAIERLYDEYDLICRQQKSKPAFSLKQLESKVAR